MNDFFANHLMYPSIGVVACLLFIATLFLMGVSLRLYKRGRIGRIEGDARKLFAISVRLSLVALCLLAIARPYWMEQTEKGARVVFLVDNSLSAEWARSKVEGYINRRLANDMDPDGKFAIMGFAESVELIAPWRKYPYKEPLISWADFKGGQDATDIERAVRAALDILPQGDAKLGAKPTLVLMTDGNENRGSLQAAAPTVRAANINFEVVILPLSEKGEIAVQRLMVPESVRLGEPFRFTLSINNANQSPAQALIQLSQDGKPVWENIPVGLFPGKNLIHLPARGDFQRPGQFFYEAEIQPFLPASDYFRENNKAGAIFRLDAPPYLYVVEAADGASNILIDKAFNTRISRMKYRLTKTLPDSTSDLVDYDCVVLYDVPVANLSLTAQQALATYVKELAGGLIVIGGPNSFDRGGYRGAPLEEILPVTAEDGKETGAATALLIFLIDFSGSMDDTLPLTKLSASKILDEVPDGVYVEVIAFDTVPQPKLEALELNSKNRQKVKDVINSLTTGQGTDLRPPLEMVLHRAKAFLEKQPDRDRGARILIFSDGYVDAAASEFQQILSHYDTNKIQVSCMGIGPEHGPGESPDPLPDIAQYGKGEYKRFESPNQKIPVFTFDTAPWKKALKYRPVWTGNEPMLSGFPARAELPIHLSEYNRCQLKPSGHLSLYVNTPAGSQPAGRNAPLLAWQHYGLGRVATFGSDAGGVWSEGLLQSLYYEKLFLQMLTFIRRSELKNYCRLDAKLDKTSGMLRLQMMTDELEEGPFGVKVFVKDQPDAPEQSISINLEPVKPGLFEGSFAQDKLKNPSRAAYAALVTKRAGGRETLYSFAKLYVQAADTNIELSRVHPNSQLLTQAAKAAGGEVLEMAHLPKPFPRVQKMERKELTDSPKGVVFGIVMIGLLFLDLAVRYGRLQGILPKRKPFLSRRVRRRF